MTDPVRVGIVGLGGMGRLHAQNLAALGAEVTAGADVIPAARASFADEFGARTYADHDAMYDSGSVDAVVITTPNAFHEPAAVGALDADLPVLVEKPLAHTLDSARRIADAEAASDGFCTVGFHNRFAPAASICRDYLAAGRFGEVTHVEANFVRRRGVPSPGSWFTDRALAGGGALVDIGGHAIDLALYLLSFPPVEEVTGVTRRNFAGEEAYADPEDFGSLWDAPGDTFDVEDSASAFVRCAGGRTVSLEVSWLANCEPTEEFVVRGTRAGARFSIGGDSLTIYEAGTAGTDHYLTSTVDGGAAPCGHEVEAERFLEAVLTGEPPAQNTIEEALAVQRVIDAVYRSSDGGRAVSPSVETSPQIRR